MILSLRTWKQTITYSNMSTLLLREDFWKLLNQFHKNSYEAILLISRENTDCDFGLEDPKVCLFHILHVEKLCPRKAAPRTVILWLDDG